MSALRRGHVMLLGVAGFLPSVIQIWARCSVHQAVHFHGMET